MPTKESIGKTGIQPSFATPLLVRLIDQKNCLFIYILRTGFLGIEIVRLKKVVYSEKGKQSDVSYASCKNKIYREIEEAFDIA